VKLIEQSKRLLRKSSPNVVADFRSGCIVA
jgi:hypothetical protein